MTAITTRFLALLLVYGAAPCVSASVQARLNPDSQETVGQAGLERVAIDTPRIRRLLGEPQPVRSQGGLPRLDSMLRVELMPQPIPVEVDGMLRFKETVDVVASRWDPPTFAEQFRAFEKRSRSPYSYAPSLQELSARLAELQYLDPVNAAMAGTKAIRGALYRRKVEKARRHVQAELRALQEQNAATAAADSKTPQKQH